MDRWFSVAFQFRLSERGESTFDIAFTVQGRSASDATGKAWAILLGCYPGAIYIASQVE